MHIAPHYILFDAPLGLSKGIDGNCQFFDNEY